MPKRTFGSMPKTVPPGFLKAVHFPVLAMLNSRTGDRRVLNADGGTTRDLPLSIRAQFASTYGHEGAVVTGTLFQVTFDPEAGVLSGDGFLLADDNGREHFRLIATAAMRGNSVDLANIRARYVEDLANNDWWVEFVSWELAATTGVGTPAFKEAHATVEWTPDELTAALGDPMDPIVAPAPDPAWFADQESIVWLQPTTGTDLDTELVAAYSAADPIPHDLFFRDEPDELTKFTVTAEGHVYGHLTGWELQHDGLPGVRCPRPTDGYASFNKPGVLTDKGLVHTGPVFLLGGHRPAKSAPTIEEAYGGIENTWADVRVTEGRLGPWCSGVVRPGTAPEAVYAARASRVSGHWVGPRLKAIVSVNAEGFDVAGNPDLELVADASDGFAFRERATGELELVAGLGGPAPAVEASSFELDEAGVRAIVAAVLAEAAGAADATEGDEGLADDSAERLRLAAALAAIDD